MLGVCVAVQAQAGWQQRPAEGRSLPQHAQWLLAQANQSRREAGAGPLQWDDALARAALEHCQRMVAEGEIAHRYGGEASVTDRTGQAGAHFSLIEENIAVASSMELIHPGWMNSAEHRRNLLNPAVDRVGIAVVYGRGMYYAVADYARGVQAFSQAGAEAEVARLVRASGVAVIADPTDARAACAMDRGLPGTVRGGQPLFVMRWQDSDLTQLPPALKDRLATGRYKRAAVGNCPAQTSAGAFTVYRMAVLLYTPGAGDLKPFY